MLTLFELYGAVLLFIGVGTAFPHVFFSTSCNDTCIMLFLAFVRYQQNRRRKVLNREALRLCRGLDILKFDNKSTDLNL